MLRRVNFRTAQQKGRDADKRLAKQYGGRAQPGSGCLKQTHNKGDVKTAEELIESKLTEKNSYKLELKILRKAEQEALSQNRWPVLLVTFAMPMAPQKHEYVVLRRDDYDSLRAAK